MQKRFDGISVQHIIATVSHQTGEELMPNSELLSGVDVDWWYG